MKINFSHDSKEFIFKLKSHIALDNPSRSLSDLEIKSFPDSL